MNADLRSLGTASTPSALRTLLDSLFLPQFDFDVFAPHRSLQKEPQIYQSYSAPFPATHHGVVGSAFPPSGKNAPLNCTPNSSQDTRGDGMDERANDVALSDTLAPGAERGREAVDDGAADVNVDVAGAAPELQPEEETASVKEAVAPALPDNNNEEETGRSEEASGTHNEKQLEFTPDESSHLPPLKLNPDPNSVDPTQSINLDFKFPPQSFDPVTQDNEQLGVTFDDFKHEITASLDPPITLDSDIALGDNIPFSSQDIMDTFHQQAAQAPPATGFAKLEFQDGHFYMTTYAVELGRDMRAYRVAQQHVARVQVKEEKETKRSQRSASVPGTPVRPVKNDAAMSAARSFLSESGGIVGEDDGHINIRKKKRKKKSQKSRSTDTSSSRSHSMSRKNSIVQAQPNFDYNQAALQTVDPNATAPLDPMVHMPDPHFTPLIPVHPPMNSDDPLPITGKGISRKHIRISYNFDRCNFEMSVYGRNGAFHDDQHYPAQSTVSLHDGSMIQIGGVSLKFVLPVSAVDTNEDLEDFESVSGRMSFSFEDGRGESIIADDESNPDSLISPSERDLALASGYEDLGFDEELLEDDEDEEEEESSEEEVIRDPKKRGPGRPRVHVRMPPPKSKERGASKTVASSSKKVTKLHLKLSAKDRAREKERARLKARAEARERARERERAEAKKAKIKAKEAARARAQAEAEAEAKAEAKAHAKAEAKAKAKAEAKEALKEPSKEPSKTPAGESSTPKEPSAPRIARDVPMQNGEEITVPGLPAGVMIPARKKGPGRPPKDGVMSKRERALLIKQNKEREKAIKMGLDPSTIPPPETKPPKPRPRRNSQGEEIDGDQDGDEEKRPKVPRPPRSPSPEMRLEDYSEEQLQRPSSNYVYLIYEAIQNAKPGVMNLQQIYSSIERKYPWYKFKAGSNGWQSSVRHNLGQHEAFKKVEKEGKGWLWGIKEGVPIERERKKKSPPPQAPPSQYPHPYQYPQYGSYPPYPPNQYAQRPPSSLAPPNLQQQGKPPGAPGQPMNANGNQQYAAPYTGQGGKPGEGSNQQPRPNQYPPSGQYPQYKNPGYGSGQPHSQPYRKYRQPAPDVIDTFKKVFISTYASKEGNDTTKAETIVNNAIKRVLEPETMVGVAKDSQEEGVIRAFEGILVQSQGPPRQPTPSHAHSHPPQPAYGHANASLQPPPSRPTVSAPVPPATANATVKLEVQAPSATAVQSTPTANHVPSPVPAQGSSGAVVPPARSVTPGQADGAHRPQGQAEANLLGQLLGGGGGSARSSSNTPPVGNSASPSGQVLAGSAGQTAAPSSATPLVTSTAPLTSAPDNSTPVVETALPPPVPNAPAALANASNPTALPAPIATPVPLNGLGLNLAMPKDAIIERLSGERTMTPTRPAVEPLTPPAAVASPQPPAANGGFSSKRGRSPSAGAADGEAKRAKVDGGE